MGKVMYMRKGDAHTAPVAPVKGIPAGELAVGNSVFLKVNGDLKEFLIVNQGIPSNSSLYDSSCDGVWLMMKDVYESRIWDGENGTAGYNYYESSDIHTYLNGGFLNLLDADVTDQIKQVKIPYNKYSETETHGTVVSGANGLSAKVFLLSGYEGGFVQSTNASVATRQLPIDGAKLQYFASGTGTSASNKRIAYLNSEAVPWWLRSRYTLNTGTVWYVTSAGDANYAGAQYMTNGIRPAFVLPSNTLFDEDTMEFVGMA